MKQAPPTNQAEYTAWRNAQKAAQKTARTQRADRAEQTQGAERDADDAKRAARAAKRAERAKQAHAAAEEANYARNHEEWARQNAEYARRQAERNAQTEREREASWNSWGARYTAPTCKYGSKAGKAAKLAVSADLIGSHEEARTAASMAGSLWRRTGAPLADLARAHAGLNTAGLWEHAVAGFAGN